MEDSASAEVLSRPFQPDTLTAAPPVQVREAAGGLGGCGRAWGGGAGPGAAARAGRGEPWPGRGRGARCVFVVGRPGSHSARGKAGSPSRFGGGFSGGLGGRERERRVRVVGEAAGIGGSGRDRPGGGRGLRVPLAEKVSFPRLCVSSRGRRDEARFAGRFAEPERFLPSVLACQPRCEIEPAGSPGVCELRPGRGVPVLEAGDPESCLFANSGVEWGGILHRKIGADVWVVLLFNPETKVLFKLGCIVVKGFL